MSFEVNQSFLKSLLHRIFSRMPNTVKRLNSAFFEQSTVHVAQALIGKVLVFRSSKGTVKGIINETEAYTQDEPACHAYRGKTPRNQTMFDRAGLLYVYFIYGMYYCANIVTETPGRGCAVLLRSIIPLQNRDLMIQNRPAKSRAIANGPGKLCQAYGLDKSHDGTDLCTKGAIVYVEDIGFTPTTIEQSTRIGISKATDLPWRFFCNDF